MPKSPFQTDVFSSLKDLKNFKYQYQYLFVKELSEIFSSSSLNFQSEKLASTKRTNWLAHQSVYFNLKSLDNFFSK